MSKLTLDALKSRAEATTSNELLATISGGTANDCHPNDYEASDPRGEATTEIDGTYVRKPRIYE